jgi:hypothetical protein
MIKLKNISQSDVILVDLGMQLMHPDDSIDLDESRKLRTSQSSQIIELISNSTIAVIDNDGTQITNISIAIDMIKGFYQKNIQTGDGKLWVQTTPRPFGTFCCLFSEGDSANSPVAVGGGQDMIFVHEVGQNLNQSLYVDFNIKENKTFINEGTIIFKNGNFDKVHLSIVPKVTPYVTGTNTNFNLYGGFLIIPAAGDGQIQVNPADIQLMEIPYSIDYPDQLQMSGFWDADYNEQTHQFENLRPNIYGTGRYSIFGYEITLQKIVRIILLGDSGIVNMSSTDVAELAHGMRLKFDFMTNIPDHDWKLTVRLKMARKYTI